MLADVNQNSACSMPPAERVEQANRLAPDPSDSAEARRVKRRKWVPRIAYKVAEASDASGIGAGVLYAAIRENQLQAYQPTRKGQMVVLRKDLIAYITRFPVNEMSSNPAESADSPAAD